LETVAEILTDSFARIRSQGIVIGTSTSEEAEFLGISAGHLSRLRNEKVPLTDDVINKIVNAFAKGDSKRGDLLRERLMRAKMVVHSRVNREKLSTAPSLFSQYSIEQISVFFKRISVSGSFLAVDYRDLPQSRKGGRYPKLALKAAEAVKNGLSFALFQPFGSAEELQKKEESLRRKFGADPEAKSFLDAYHYLYDLAMGVREVYRYMKEESEKDGPCKGSIVLYEAIRIKDSVKVAPSLTACGIQSRLFYADYSDSIRHYREVYEWVVAHPDDDFFIQRGEASINLAAVRAQFSPIFNYWEANEHKLPVGEEITKAYEKFFSPFGQETERDIRWRDWSRK